jgi:hypothetical protein
MNLTQSNHWYFTKFESDEGMTHVVIFSLEPVQYKVLSVRDQEYINATLTVLKTEELLK